MSCTMFWLIFLFLQILQTFLFLVAADVVRPHMQRLLVDYSGFISIDCGQGGGSYYDTTSKLYYTSDDKYISTGENKGISTDFYNVAGSSIYKTVRSFPKGRRNCYNLRPLKANIKYLIRAQFMYGNYDGKNLIPGFDVYIGANLWFTVALSSADTRRFEEIIYFTTTNSVDVCLVNKDQGTPFISALLLRPLDNSSYPASPQFSLSLWTRDDYGCATSTPTFYQMYDDTYNRLWDCLPSLTDWSVISTNQSFDDSQASSLKVPTSVLKNAVMSNNDIATLTFKLNAPDIDQVCVYWHFTELELLRSNETREFNISVPNGEGYTSGPINPKYLQLTSISSPRISLSGSDSFEFTLMKTSKSDLLPIINAMELYTVLDLPALPTNQEDADAIIAIRDKYGVSKLWQGDPCLPVNYQWEGLNCTYDDNNPPRITSLSLSSSNLIGEIPPTLSNLKTLKYLNLSDNGFTGSIPEFLAYLPSLIVIDLTGNNLTGPVPLELVEKATNKSIDLRLEGNHDVCKTYPCEEKKEVNKKRHQFIIPIVTCVASISLLVIIGFAFLAIKRRKKQERVGVHAIKSKNKQFKSLEIVRMTDSFREVLGRGAFGIVYHGVLQDGIEVAVKVLNNTSSPITMKQFCAEAELLTRIHHVNLVTLIGYCDEHASMALVYEYMPCGNLQMHLSERNEHPLSWKTRLQISIDTGQGLEYLHSGCRPPIIHRDVKPANILLDEMGNAKIADFGLSRFFTDSNRGSYMTELAGTRGYLDPEYCQMNILSDKSDVYGFGIVLLQLLTAQSTFIKYNDHSNDNEPIHIINWVTPMVESGDILEIIDKRLQGDFNVNTAWKFLEIAMECVKPMGNQRPRMSEVVADLKMCYASEGFHDQNGVAGNDRGFCMDSSGTYEGSLTSVPGAR